MSDYDSATDTFVESRTQQKKRAPIEGMSRGLEELGQLRAEVDELKKEVKDVKSKTTTQKKRSEALGGADEDGVFIFTTS